MVLYSHFAEKVDSFLSPSPPRYFSQPISNSPTTTVTQMDQQNQQLDQQQLDEQQQQLIRRPIEAPLDDAMERIMSQPNVKGVVISDKEGLCVGSRGYLAPINAARLTNIFDSAMKMAPDHEIVSNGQVFVVPEQPIIIIESMSGQLILNNIDGFCTTIAISHK